MSAAEQVQLLIIQGAISNLTADKQKQVKDVAEHLRESIAAAGDEGLFAFALVAAEMAAAA